jgi:hypothetical protein
MDAEAIWGIVCKSLMAHKDPLHILVDLYLLRMFILLCSQNDHLLQNCREHTFPNVCKGEILEMTKIHQFWTSTKMFVRSYHKTPMVS